MSQKKENSTENQNEFDPIMFSNRWQELIIQSQKTWLEKIQNFSPDDFKKSDPFGLADLVQDFWQHVANNPEAVMKAQIAFIDDYMHLLQETYKGLNGEEYTKTIAPEIGDRRFKDETWNSHPFFDFVKQSYLIFSKNLLQGVSKLEGLDDKTAKRIDFFTKQFVNALAPSNFFLTNPTVLKETIDRKGENLLEGYKNFIKDLQNKSDSFSLSIVDKEAFKVGENLATTSGNVIYRNDLIELIHYTPTSDTVYKTPLLIIPPWINKYYILDLQENNSFIKWGIEQGFDVFCISWVNPDKELAQKKFESYLDEGLLAALDQVKKQTGEEQINCAGYCLGGTLLSCGLSYLKQKKRNDIKSATFLTTMIDFSGAGDMQVFIDEKQLKTLEDKIKQIGYLPSEDLKQVFSLMRANDLIWSFFVNNYLMGKEPLPFDLLYWNDDATRMPYEMHMFYLREMYLKNNLVEKNAIELLGTKIDISVIDTPSYFVSAREDHIAPWKTTYEGPKHFKGEKQFILTEAGHIAGIINPPSKNKYGYWTQKTWPELSEEWLNDAKYKKESWWLHWQKWITKKSGQKVTRNYKKPVLKSLCPAPGTYILEQS